MNQHIKIESAVQPTQPAARLRSQPKAMTEPSPILSVPSAIHPASAGDGQAISWQTPKASVPDRQSPLDGHIGHGTQPAAAVEADETEVPASTATRLPRRQKSRASGEKQASARTLPMVGVPASQPILNGHLVGDTHPHHAVEGDERAPCSADTRCACSPLIAEIVQLWRMRQRWWKAEIKLILQAQAVCRSWTDGDKIAAAKLYAKAKAGDDVDPTLTIALGPFFDGMRPFDEIGTAYEKRIAKAARSLPVYPWAKALWGFSDLGLGKIVGEAGDLGAYRNPSCLWKRMGLAVIGDKRQRRVSDADEALLHGYNPQRRSVMWNIGGGVIGGMGKGVRPLVGEDWQAREDWSQYQKLYVSRLIYEAERDPTMAREPTAAGKLSFAAHAHNRAKRYVEKRLLRDLWRAWRAAA